MVIPLLQQAQQVPWSFESFDLFAFFALSLSRLPTAALISP
jgi:hypothetical protein